MLASSSNVAEVVGSNLRETLDQGVFVSDFSSLISDVLLRAAFRSVS